MQYKYKFFEEFKRFSHFPGKIVLYSLTKLCINKPGTNIQSVRRFDQGFWQTSKQTCTKFQHKEPVFGEFQNLPWFPRKMVLYLLSKLSITKPLKNIQLLRNFDLAIWQTSKWIYKKLQCKEKGFEGFQDLLWFTRKMAFYSCKKHGVTKPWTSIQSLRWLDLVFW